MADPTVSTIRINVAITGQDSLTRFAAAFRQVGTAAQTRPQEQARFQSEQQATSSVPGLARNFAEGLASSGLSVLKAPFDVLRTTAGIASNTILSFIGPIARLGVSAAFAAPTLIAAGVTLAAVSVPLFNLAATFGLLRASFRWAKTAAEDQMRTIARTRQLFPGSIGAEFQRAQQITETKLKVGAALFGPAADAIMTNITRRFTQQRLAGGMGGDPNIFLRWGITPDMITAMQNFGGEGRYTLTDWLFLFIRKREEINNRIAASVPGSRQEASLTRLKGQLATDSVKIFGQEFGDLVGAMTTEDMTRLTSNMAAANKLGEAAEGNEQYGTEFDIALKTLLNTFHQLAGGISDTVAPRITEIMDTLRVWLLPVEEGGKGMGSALRGLISELSIHSWETLKQLLDDIDVEEVKNVMRSVREGWNPAQVITDMQAAAPVIRELAEFVGLLAAAVKFVFSFTPADALRRMQRNEQDRESGWGWGPHVDWSGEVTGERGKIYWGRGGVSGYGGGGIAPGYGGAGQYLGGGGVPLTAAERAALPSEWGGEVSRANMQIPAAIRYNNPGAQWPNRESREKYGQTDYGIIGGGNQIAGFPTPVHGLAANIDLLGKRYVGKTMSQAIREWSGGGRSSVPGYSDMRVITQADLQDPQFIQSFFTTMQKAEAGRVWMTPEQIKAGHEMYLAGGAKEYMQQIGRMPITPQPVSPTDTSAIGGGSVTQIQSRVAGIRRGALDPRLVDALDYAANQTGLQVRVTSGGQRMPGVPGATGSHRHDWGRAADFDLVDPRTGQILAHNDTRRLAFLEAASRAGAGGAGASYMSDIRKIHMGITGSAAIVGQGLGAYAGTPAEREAIARGIQQSRTFNLAEWKRTQGGAAQEQTAAAAASVPFTLDANTLARQKTREEQQRALTEPPPQESVDRAIKEGSAAGKAMAESFNDGIKDTKIPIKPLTEDEKNRAAENTVAKAA